MVLIDYFFFLMIRRPARSTRFPATPLFRSRVVELDPEPALVEARDRRAELGPPPVRRVLVGAGVGGRARARLHHGGRGRERKSTRFKSRPATIPYAGFFLTKKKYIMHLSKI